VDVVQLRASDPDLFAVNENMKASDEDKLDENELIGQVSALSKRY
jgi:hypothetical protein